jgi:hypothetical protein
MKMVSFKPKMGKQVASNHPNFKIFMKMITRFGKTLAFGAAHYNYAHYLPGTNCQEGHNNSVQMMMILCQSPGEQECLHRPGNFSLGI